MENPWRCNCHLKDFREFVINSNLSPSPLICYEPERLSDRTWKEVSPNDFACKPNVNLSKRYVKVTSGSSATIQCLITGSPVPDVKWVLDGRIIANISSLLHSGPQDQQFVIQDTVDIRGRILFIATGLCISQTIRCISKHPFE